MWRIEHSIKKHILFLHWEGIEQWEKILHPKEPKQKNPKFSHIFGNFEDKIGKYSDPPLLLSIFQQVFWDVGTGE